VTGAADRPGRPLIDGVRRFGLVSADLVVDRYVRLAEQMTDELPGTPRLPAVPRLADATTGLAGAWLRLLEVTAALADRSAGGGPAVSSLELPAAEPAGVAEAAVWVHNTTPAPATVELTATPLTAPGGAAIGADAVRLLPARLDPVPARSSTEVRLRVDVPATQEPGRYQGLLLSSTGQPLLVLLEVRAAGGPAR
jgi:hypothetical protein